MKTGVKTTDVRGEFVVIPSDQVQVAPSDAEITNLLRAAARQHSDTGVNAADASASAPVPMVDTKFRASAVNDDVPTPGPTLGRRMMRGFAAILLALGIGAAAVSWQTFGYAAKKVLISWAPKWAIAASLPLDKLGLGSNSSPSDNPDDAVPAQADAAAPAATDASTHANTAAANTVANASPAAPSPEATQQLQSMSRDLASANQEIATLKASIAELKAGQQQMARDLAKAASDRTAELAARAKAAAARKLATTTALPPAPTYRPNPSAYSAQAAVPQSSPQVTAQPYAPPQPMQIQPQADPGLPPTALRPPMPVQ